MGAMSLRIVNALIKLKLQFGGMLVPYYTKYCRQNWFLSGYTVHSFLFNHYQTTILWVSLKAFQPDKITGQRERERVHYGQDLIRRELANGFLQVHSCLAVHGCNRIKTWNEVHLCLIQPLYFFPQYLKSLLCSSGITVIIERMTATDQ